MISGGGGGGRGCKVGSALAFVSTYSFTSQKCPFTIRIALLFSRSALLFSRSIFLFLKNALTFPDVLSFYLPCAFFSKNAFFSADCSFSSSCSKLLRQIFVLLLFCFSLELSIDNALHLACACLYDQAINKLQPQETQLSLADFLYVNSPSYNFKQGPHIFLKHCCSGDI